MDFEESYLCLVCLTGQFKRLQDVFSSKLSVQDISMFHFNIHVSTR